MMSLALLMAADLEQDGVRYLLDLTILVLLTSIVFLAIKLVR